MSVKLGSEFKSLIVNQESDIRFKLTIYSTAKPNGEKKMSCIPWWWHSGGNLLLYQIFIPLIYWNNVFAADWLVELIGKNIYLYICRDDHRDFLIDVFVEMFIDICSVDTSVETNFENTLVEISVEAHFIKTIIEIPDIAAHFANQEHQNYYDWREQKYIACKYNSDLEQVTLELAPDIIIEEKEEDVFYQWVN